LLRYITGKTILFSKLTGWLCTPLSTTATIEYLPGAKTFADIDNSPVGTSRIHFDISAQDLVGRTEADLYKLHRTLPVFPFRPLREKISARSNDASHQCSLVTIYLGLGRCRVSNVGAKVFQCLGNTPVLTLFLIPSSVSFLSLGIKIL